jgi:hypothetical protein
LVWFASAANQACYAASQEKSHVCMDNVLDSDWCKSFVVLLALNTLSAAGLCAALVRLLLASSLSRDILFHPVVRKHRPFRSPGFSSCSRSSSQPDLLGVPLLVDQPRALPALRPPDPLVRLEVFSSSARSALRLALFSS